MREREPETLRQRIRAQHDALLLLHRGHARRDGARAGRGVDQTRGVDRDRLRVGARQRPGEGDVQADQPAVGLLGVVADLDVARADVGQSREFGLHARGQRGAVAAVADASRGLAAVAEREVAPGHALGAGELHLQAGQVDTRERPAEGDEVGVAACAGYLHASGAAQRHVQRVGHRGGVGADLDAGGLVVIAAVMQSQRETARAGVHLDLLHLGLRRAVGQRGVGVAGAGGSLAAQVELEARGRDRTPSQLAGEAHHVAVALALVGAVELDPHGAGLDLPAGEVLQQRGVGRAHLGDGVLHRAVAAVDRAHALGRVRHQEDVVLLDDLLGLEDDGQRRRGPGPARLHLGHAGAARRRLGLRVAHQRQALHLARARHGGRLLLHQPVGDEVDGVVARALRAREGDGVDLVHAGLAVVERAHRDADRRRLLAQRLQHHLLALVHPGLRGLGLLHLVCRGRGLGACRDARHVHARQRADELHHVAVHAVARDLHVARAHALQALQPRLQLGQHLLFGVAAADLHVRAAGRVARARGALQLQRAHEVVREAQRQLGVDLDRLLGLRRQRDALVDVHQHLLGLHRQPVDALELRARRRGLQAGEAPAVVFRVLDQRQPEVHLPELQAHLAGGAAVDARKSVDAAAADGDEPRVLDRRAVGQRHVLAALLDPETALHTDEAEQVHVQMAGRLDDLAL